MNNFGKKLWFGALFSPKCWLCAAVNHQIIGGAVAVALFLAIGWFTTAGYAALFVLLFMMHLVITPEKSYAMQLEDKQLLILIFKSDFVRRNKADVRRKCSTVRIIVMHDGGKSEVTMKGNEVFGFDDNLCEFGIFLLKPYPAMWAIICNGFEDGRFLGRKLKNYVFAERSNFGTSVLHFLHGTELFTLEAKAIEIEPKVTFAIPSAVYHALTDSVHPEIAKIDAAKVDGSLIMANSGTHPRLFKCCFTATGMPAVFLITVPWLRWEKNNEKLIFTADSDGILNFSGKCSADNHAPVA